METEKTLPELYTLMSNPAWQRKVSEFVSREVICCASYLVSEIAKATTEQKIGDMIFEDILPVLQQDQWINTFEYTCNTCDHSWEECDNDPTTERGEGLDNDDFTASCPKCQNNTSCEKITSDESDPLEAYEHWIISDWLAGRLEKRGGMILRDFFDFTIWGRPTTGQSISMDCVINEIYFDLVKEDLKTEHMAKELGLS